MKARLVRAKNAADDASPAPALGILGEALRPKLAHDQHDCNNAERQRRRPISSPSRLASNQVESLSSPIAGRLGGAARLRSSCGAALLSSSRCFAPALSASGEKFEKADFGARQPLAPSRLFHPVERIARLLLHRFEQLRVDVGLAADRGRIAERLRDRFDHRLYA